MQTDRLSSGLVRKWSLKVSKWLTGLSSLHRSIWPTPPSLVFPVCSQYTSKQAFDGNVFPSEVKAIDWWIDDQILSMISWAIGHPWHLLIQGLVVLKEAFEGLEDFHFGADASGGGSLPLDHRHPQRPLVPESPDYDYNYINRWIN